LYLMKTLGVGINMSKSLVSDHFGEFAKRYVGPTFDLSPIGAGNLLQAVRRPMHIGSVIVEMYTKAVITNLEADLIPLHREFPLKGTLNELNFWTFYVLCSALASTHSDTDLSANENTCGVAPQTLLGPLVPELYAVLRKETGEVLLQSYHKAKAEEKRFHSQFYKLNAFGRSKSLLNSLGLLLSPGLYLYGLAFLSATESIRTLCVRFAYEAWDPARADILLRTYSNFPVLSVKWKAASMKSQARFVRKLSKDYAELLVRSRSRW